MLKVIALVFAAVVACTAIGTWAAANSRSQNAKTFRAVSEPIDPHAFMRAAPSNLPHEQYDAH